MAAALGNHNHVQRVSPHEWEDEAFTELADDVDSRVSGAEKSTKAQPLRQAAAALRSSFNALRISSVTERPGSKTNLGKPSGRESSTGIVGSLASLGRGLANAVGLHRDGSPIRDVSPSDGSACRSKLVTSQSRNLVRLSSAAMMRAELQNYSQFGDLRNDSFSSPASTKLMRRSSLLPKGSDSSITVPTPPAGPRTSCHKAGSGDLGRHSTTGCPGSYVQPCRLTCPGELPSPFPTAAPSPQPPPPLAADAGGGAAQSPFNRHIRASSYNLDGGGGGGGGGSSGGGAFNNAGSTPPSRSASGPTPPPPSSPTHNPLMVSSVHPHPPTQPHPPQQPRPGPVALPPEAPRSISTDHLPPMQSPGPSAAGGTASGSTAVRDRPPTPRAGRTAISGSPTSKFAQVLGSFHLPDILVGGSAKSVTERRSSVTGEGSEARTRRNSVSGPTGMGPGGAAINASIAKRAAAAAVVSAVPLSPGAGAAVPLAVSPSGASGTSLPRSSAPSITGRVGSITGKAPGSILQDFHSSLELEEDKDLAAVDAEFDRRFRQSSTGGPASLEVTQPGSGQQPPHLLPQAPRSERTTPQGGFRRPVGHANDTSWGGNNAPGTSVDCNRRRQSCSATLFTTADNINAVCPDGDAGGGPAADAMLLTSMDTIQSLGTGVSCSGPVANAKMRLASIRLSYAEGIVPGAGASAGSRRASLDVPASPHNRTSPTAWPQSPGPASRPHLPGISVLSVGPSP